MVPVIPIAFNGSASSRSFKEWFLNLEKNLALEFEKCMNVSSFLNNLDNFGEQMKLLHFQAYKIDELPKDNGFVSEIMWSSFGFSVGSCELGLRNENASIFEIPDSTRIRLKVLFYAGIAHRHKDATLLENRSQALIQILLGKREKKFRQQALFLDPFSLFVQILFLWPRPNNLNCEVENIVQLCYHLLIVQIFAKILADPDEKKNFSSDLVKTLESIFIHKKMKVQQLKSIKFTNASDLNQLKSRILPFLRRIALILLACFGKAPPPNSSQINSTFISNSNNTQPSNIPLTNSVIVNQMNEAISTLCEYLNLPVLEEIFTTDFWNLDFKLSKSKWTQSLKSEPLPFLWIEMAQLEKGKSISELKENIPVNPSFQSFRLVPLPKLYHDLLQKFSKGKCHNCKTVPSTPAICLVCGTLVCVSKSCCRNSDTFAEGECTQVI